MTQTKPKKIWNMKREDPQQCEKLSKALGIAPVVAQILLNRGMTEPEAAKTFLFGGVEILGDPFAMLGVKQATERIGQAIDGNQRIIVYGDYDVDGITATALLVRVLRRLGANNVGYYVPERQSEGYGLNQTALEQLAEDGATLVITVDCGIASVTEIAAMTGKLEVIVTDHHQPPEELPPAYAIINPKQPLCPYPDKQLAGVGVAFKLCQAIWLSRRGETFTELLDLVAVGTVADVVPLTGENRVLVKLGLQQLAATTIPGLRALIEVTGLNNAALDSGKIGFIIGPRLNAAGRVSHAMVGVELLLTEDLVQAKVMAEELDTENARRQAVEKELLTAAEALLAQIDLTSQKVLVLSGPDWHPGVIGIAASRLVERFYRPVVMISVRDGIGKGSCRSIPAFDLYKALQQCDDLLVQYGGHRQAAGLTIDPAKIDLFRERLNAVATEWLTEEDCRPVLDIDATLALAEINQGLVEQLASLAPFGQGNPSPVLVSRKLSVVSARVIGQEGRHLKLRVKYRGAASEVVAWGMGPRAAELMDEAAVDLAYVPEFNTWRGQQSIQLKAHDLKLWQPEVGQTRLIDARRTSDRLACLQRLLQQERQPVILVNNRRQALSLLCKLRGSGHSRRVVLCHSHQPPNRRKALLKEFAGGGRILIGTPDALPEGVPVSTWILWEPPDSQVVFRSLGQRIARAGKAEVCFLFDVATCKTKIINILAGYPDRDMTAQVYLSLKAAGEMTEAVFTGKILSGNFPISAEGVAKAFTILQELGLLERGAMLRLNPVPAEKLAIEQSATFNACAKQRAVSQAYFINLATLPIEEVWRDAVENSQMTDN